MKWAQASAPKSTPALTPAPSVPSNLNDRDLPADSDSDPMEPSIDQVLWQNLQRFAAKKGKPALVAANQKIQEYIKE